MWRHVTEDPVRALLLGWRVLPGRVRPWLKWAGPYGRATVAWGSGDRKQALALLHTTPRRLAAFALAVDRPDAARRSCRNSRRAITEHMAAGQAHMPAMKAAKRCIP